HRLLRSRFEPALGHLGFQGVRLEARVLRPKIGLPEAHDIERFDPPVLAFPRLVLRNQPFRPVLDDHAPAPADVGLGSMMAQRRRLADRDAITDQEASHAAAPWRARTSSILAASSDTVTSPL